MNCFLIFKIKLAELKKPATTILKRQCKNKGQKTGFSTLFPLGLTDCVFEFSYHNSYGLSDSRTLKNCQKNHRPIFYLRKYVGQTHHSIWIQFIKIRQIIPEFYIPEKPKGSKNLRHLVYLRLVHQASKEQLSLSE